LKKHSYLYSNLFFCCILFWTCTSGDNAAKAIQDSIQAKKDSILHCTSNIPNRFGVGATDTLSIVKGVADKAGMVLISGGGFIMGCSDKTGRADEYPQHSVTVSSFWMDTHRSNQCPVCKICGSNWLCYYRRKSTGLE